MGLIKVLINFYACGNWVVEKNTYLMFFNFATIEACAGVLCLLGGILVIQNIV